MSFYMDDKMAEVLERVESIKEKLTDAEYKDLMDSLGKVHDIGEPDWDSIWLECVVDSPNFGNAVPAIILTKVQLAESTSDRLRLLAQFIDRAYNKLHENEHALASLGRLLCQLERNAERAYLTNA